MTLFSSLFSFFALVFLFLVMPNSIYGDTTHSNKLKGIHRDIANITENKSMLSQRKEKLEDEVLKIQNKLVKSARIIQENEKEILNVQIKLRHLSQAHDNALKKLNNNHLNIQKMFVALYRVAQFPPEALIALPVTPADTVRSSVLLRSNLEIIEKRSASLTGMVNMLSETREMVSYENKRLESLRSSLNKQQRHLSALVARKKQLKRRTDSEIYQENRRLSHLAQKAKTLEELIESLNSKQRREVAKNPFSPKRATNRPKKYSPASISKGKLLFPVVGKLKTHFGQKSSSGLVQKGITIESRAKSQVIATFDGKVVFTGKFRGYGLLLIIEHGKGYHSLLAGLSRIDVKPGVALIAGEPVGIMGATSGQKQILYAEFRHNGQPINLVPWFLSENKLNKEVNG